MSCEGTLHPEGDWNLECNVQGDGGSRYSHTIEQVVRHLAEHLN